MNVTRCIYPFSIDGHFLLLPFYLFHPTKLPCQQPPNFSRYIQKKIIPTDSEATTRILLAHNQNTTFRGTIETIRFKFSYPSCFSIKYFLRRTYAPKSSVPLGHLGASWLPQDLPQSVPFLYIVNLSLSSSTLLPNYDNLQVNLSSPPYPS